MKEFIDLHNRTVSRDEIQTVIALAKEQNNTEVIYRLSKILNDHPDSKRFNINIINYPQETDNQAGLAGTRHSGDYREALDECGRLKKGWHFVDGKVVKTQPKPQKAPKEATKSPSSDKSAPSDSSSNKTTLYKLNFSDVNYNKKIVENLKNNQTGEYDLLKKDMIGINFSLAILEKYLSLEQLSTLYGKEKEKEAKKDYVFVKERIEWAFNHNIKTAKRYHTLNDCKEFFAEKLPTLLAKGGQWLEAKAQGKNSATAKGQFTKVVKQTFDEMALIAVLSERENDEIAFLSAAGIDYFPEAPDDETQGLGKPVPTADIYKMVTDKIIGMLKSASPTDYKRAWKDDAFFIPLNYDSKKPYRGVNRLLLQERIGFAGAFRNPYFLTFNQIKKHKGTLKKGAKGYEVIYYSIRYVVPADKNSGRKAYSSTNAQKVLDFLHKYNLPESEVTRIPMIRYYNVYNGADIENIDFKLSELQIGRAVPDSATENRAAQLIVENYPNPPAIKHEGNQAYYNPASDYIKLPKQEQFDTVNDYYRTLFHELTHSTGHNKRLNRGIHLMLEKDDYAKEELVAEFGAVFLSAWAGIMWYNNKNHAAYLKGWNSAIKEAQNDNKFLMRAASLAQQATDYILALDKDGNPAFLKKLQGKKAPKTPTDKSAPSDTESYFSQREEQVKRAELIRKARKEGHTEEEIRQRAKKLGYDNIDLLINLSYLNPKGEISSAYIYYPDNETPTITKMVNWAGEARRKYPFLEDEHEQQFFDLYDQQFYEKKDKKYLFEKIEELASKYHSFEELMKKHNIKGNVFFFDKLIAAVKVSLRKSNYKEIPDWYIRYSVPIDTDKPLTKENKDFLKKYFAAEVSKVVKPFALKEKYTTWVEFKQKGLELLSKIITTSAKSEKSDSSSKIPALGSLFGKYHEINTLAFKKMKVTELRAFTLEFYRLFLKGKKKEIEKHLKEVVFTSEGGRKIAYGEAMYSAKAAVIEHLGALIKNSTYNNWGDKKPSDSEEILGYLNFKSKITIDGKKRHVRIAISVDKDRNLKFKSYDVGKKKSASTHKGVKPFNGGVETLYNESTAKTVPNFALSAPRHATAPEVFVEYSSDPSDQSNTAITPRNNSLANRMAALQNRTFETFIIANKQMQAFLGDVERKNTGSTAITITGGAGSGKTRFAFQFINALAQNYKVGHASLEEQPDSKLYFDKVQQYLDETAQANVEAPEIENMQDLQALIERNDVIVIDSFTKIREWDRNFLLDRDLRKKYNGKLFLIIFQQTVAGNMRGGTTSEFDGDIILYTQVFPDYRENYIYPSKNRYNSTPREQLRYSVYYQQLLPDESSPSPATSNTYEVIY